MSRMTSTLLPASTLALGLLLGLNLAAGRRTILADPAPTPRPVAADPDVTPARGEAAIYEQIDRQYALFEHVNRTFELVSRAVSPSVVHIVAHKVGRAEGDRRAQEFEETGSGVIVRAEGGTDRGLFVLTNNHVVAGAGAEAIQIVLNDGRSIRPERLWSDSRADIAVLRLGRDDLPAARLGDSDKLAVGTWVMAIGSPFGLTHSVSQGIISGRGRHEPDLEKAGVENQDFLQTDAAINPGNSGGPLVNMRGEVVGLNIAILSNGGGNEGVGFSIPINLARWIMNALVATGRVPRGALGVKLQPEFLPETAVALGLDRPRGAWVDSVDKASPAALGGVRVGDVILKFNGSEVSDLNHLINLVSMSPIGRAADVVVWRDRKELTLRVTVADKDQALAATPPRPSRPLPGPNALAGHTDPADVGPFRILGIELATLDAALAARLGLPANLAGAVVTKIDADSPLGAYFQAHDVIHAVGSRPIRDAGDAVRALNERADQEHLELALHRLKDGAIHTIKVRLP